MRIFQNNNRFSFFLQEIMELFEISPLTGIKVLKLIKRLGRPILKKKKKKKKNQFYNCLQPSTFIICPSQERNNVETEEKLENKHKKNKN